MDISHLGFLGHARWSRQVPQIHPEIAKARNQLTDSVNEFVPLSDVLHYTPCGDIFEMFQLL
jgi:hypothetical protein